MVTKEEMKKFGTTNVSKEPGASFHVTAEEMRRFAVNAELNNRVYNIITEYTKKHNIKPKYEGIEDRCQLSASTLKKSCAGTIRITRLFLYKLTVGLQIDLNEANELFALCGGPLNEHSPEDYICIKALIDKDDINHFIDQFNEFVKEYDHLQEGDKLKKLKY